MVQWSPAVRFVDLVIVDALAAEREPTSERPTDLSEHSWRCPLSVIHRTEIGHGAHSFTSLLCQFTVAARRSRIWRAVVNSSFPMSSVTIINVDLPYKSVRWIHVSCHNQQLFRNSHCSKWQASRDFAIKASDRRTCSTVAAISHNTYTMQVTYQDPSTFSNAPGTVHLVDLQRTTQRKHADGHNRDVVLVPVPTVVDRACP